MPTKINKDSLFVYFSLFTITTYTTSTSTTINTITSIKLQQPIIDYYMPVLEVYRFADTPIRIV